jgi:ATP-dependent RNA helicase DDX27
VGGLSNKVQEAALRRHPDIVVATPGRIIDHLRNAQSFTLETVDILVLDEADRLLSLGFADELEQIIRFCPENRQTLLFSATMTEEVLHLASPSLVMARMQAT